MKKKNQIEAINCDLIKRLRSQGKWHEANQLIKAFRNNCKKQKRVDKNKFNRTLRLIKKNKGMCANNYCKKMAMPNLTLCKKCYESIKKSKMKKENVCKFPKCENHTENKYCKFHEGWPVGDIHLQRLWKKQRNLCNKPGCFNTKKENYLICSACLIKTRNYNEKRKKKNVRRNNY